MDYSTGNTHPRILWPGNEVELHRFIARMCHEQGIASLDLSSDLTNRLSPCFQDAHRDRTEAQIEKEVLINSLRVHAGQLRLVADELSTTVETLKEQINLWNITQPNSTRGWGQRRMRKFPAICTDCGHESN